MTPQERQVLEDAEAQAFESSQIEGDDESTGVPKPPVIESTETILEAGVFGFEFAGQPTATAEPGASAPPDDEVTGACCTGDGECTVLTPEACAEADGLYQGDGTDCDGDPCPCSAATHLTADFTFDYDDGTFSFSGSGTAEDDIGGVCSFSKTELVEVTVHEAGEADCAPPCNVSCSVSVDYVGSGEWSLDAQVLLPDHSTVCDGGGFPVTSISSSLAAVSFFGFTASEDLIPDTTPNMNAHVNITLTDP